MISLPGIGLRASRRLWLVIFLAPAVLLFAAFATYPIVSALAYSLYAWEGIGRKDFAGLGNFVRLFQTFPYPRLLANAFWHNVVVFCLTMLIQNVAGLGLALLLARGPRGARAYRVIFFQPVTLSLVIVGFMWALFLNPVFGVVNKALAVVGLEALARPWLGDPQTALVTSTLINAWRWLGFPTLVFLAGINAVPDDYIEAARIDGAGEWTIFTRVMLPLVRPALVIVTIYNAIPIWNDFFFPLVFIKSDHLKTLPLGMTTFFGQYYTDYAALFAGLVVAAVPVVALYVVLSQHFIRGLTAGAVKG